MSDSGIPAPAPRIQGDLLAQPRRDMTPEEMLDVLTKAREAQQERLKSIQRDGDGVVFKFKQGRVSIKVPPLSFYNLDKCWDRIGDAAAAVDVVQRFKACLDVVAAALEDAPEPKTAEELQKLLQGKDWQEFTAAYSILMVESGLIIEEDILPQVPTLEALERAMAASPQIPVPQAIADLNQYRSQSQTVSSGEGSGSSSLSSREQDLQDLGEGARTLLRMNGNPDPTSTH